MIHIFPCGYFYNLYHSTPMPLPKKKEPNWIYSIQWSHAFPYTNHMQQGFVDRFRIFISIQPESLHLEIWNILLLTLK